MRIVAYTANADEVTADDVSVERAFPSGAWNLSAIVDGHLMHRTYFDYTREEALTEFLVEANTYAT